MTSTPRHLWRVAGALALAHVVLIPFSLALEMPAQLADGVEGIVESYVQGDLTRAFAGGILESLAFLLLIPVLVFLGRVLGRTGEASAWMAQTGVMCGVAYVALTFAVGFPAGAAAMYGAQHGLDLEAALALNNLRNFAYFLSLMLLGGSTLGFAGAALAGGLHRLWWGGLGTATGVLLVISTPLAAVGLHDFGTLAWMVWFVGVGVLMLRHREQDGVIELPDDEPLRSGSI